MHLYLRLRVPKSKKEHMHLIPAYTLCDSGNQYA